MHLSDSDSFPCPPLWPKSGTWDLFSRIPHTRISLSTNFCPDPEWLQKALFTALPIGFGARELFFWILRPQISLGTNFYPNCSRSSWEMKRLFLIFFRDFLWTGHRGEVEWFLNDPKIIQWSIPRLCGASFGVIRALPPPNPFFCKKLVRLILVEAFSTLPFFRDPFFLT